MPKWKRLWLVLVLAVPCIVGSTTGLWAEERGTRVAIVEMARVLDESSAVHSIRAQGEAQRKVYAEDAQREAGRLRAIRDEINRQETLLAPDALEQRQREFSAEVTAAEQQAQAHSQILQRAMTDGENQFRHALNTVVAEVAQQNSIEIVLPVQAALFAVADVNLTDPVIERLNETFPEIALTFDEN